MVSLIASVGRGGINRAQDVVVVQILLNQWIAFGALKGHSPVLTVGTCNNAMVQTIGKFQSVVVGMMHPDHRIDPNGRTWKALNALTAVRLATPPAAAPTVVAKGSVPPIDDSKPWDLSAEEIPLSGSMPVAVGMSTVVRIPVPATNGLAVELSPRGWTPKGGSTSTVFIQDVTGKKHLRLDYGYNVKTKTIDYHWNNKGTYPTFGISDHATVGTAGRVTYKAAKYLRWGGRRLLIVGAVLDGISIVQASRPLRRATEVVAGWAGAWVGCKVVGAGGAKIGSVKPVLGTAIGAFLGCIVGGGAGYFVGSSTAREVWDWAEETTFTSLQEGMGPF